MKNYFFLLALLFLSITVQSQIHITDIDLGYNINSGYKINGWEEAKWKEETNLKYKAKSFLINYKRKRTGDDLQEYLEYGGKDFTVLTLFYETSGKVVAVKESSSIHKPRIYGLKWYDRIKQNKKDLSSRLSSVIEMDDFRSNEILKRYYSVFIKGVDNQDIMQVFTIKDKLITKEYYFSKSNYQSVSWVSNPYQKIKKLSSLFDEKEFLKLCKDVTKREKNSDEICNCVIRGMKESFKSNMGDLELSNLYSDAFSKCYSNTYYFKSKKFKVVMPEGKSQVFYQTTVNLNLREEANTNSKVIVMIPQGDAVLSKEEFTNFENTFLINEVDIKAKWVKVWYGKLQGWLFMGGLKDTDPEHYADQEYYKRLKKKNK